MPSVCQVRIRSDSPQSGGMIWQRKVLSETGGRSWSRALQLLKHDHAVIAGSRSGVQLAKDNAQRWSPPT